MAGYSRRQTATNVVAHGIDLIETDEFARLIEKQAGPHIDRYFTAAELAAAGEGHVRAEKLASRFATKEATIKALGLGWGDGVAFTDVEVRTMPTGAPMVVLHRRPKKVARERGIVEWLVSASHTRSAVVASVIGLANSAAPAGKN